MDLRIDTSGLDKLAKQVEQFGGNAKKAQARALNRALTTAASTMQKTIREQYTLKAADVKGAIKKHNAKESDLTATLSVSGRLLSMAHFRFTPKTSEGRQKGNNRTKTGKVKKLPTVKTTIKKGSAKKPTAPTFVARTTKGNLEDVKYPYNVFERFGDKRTMIAPMRTISIAQMASSKKIHKATAKAAEQTLEKRIPVELQFEMDKATKK